MQRHGGKFHTDVNPFVLLRPVVSNKAIATNGSKLYLLGEESQHLAAPGLEPGELISVVQVELDVFCLGTNHGRLLWQYEQDLEWQCYNTSDRKPVEWIRLALPYVTLGIGRDVHALQVSRSQQQASFLGTYYPPEDETVAVSRYLGGVELRGSRVDAVIKREGDLVCWYGMGTQAFRCRVTDCTSMYDITSNGTLFIMRKSDAPTLVQAISCQSVAVPQVWDQDICDIAVVEANDALVLVTLRPHTISVWTYIGSSWQSDVIPIENRPRKPLDCKLVRAAAFDSQIFVYWLREGTVGMASATINEKASRPPELLPHEPILSAASSINQILAPMQSLLETGGTLWPLYGDRVLDAAIRERNVRLLRQGMLPYEGWLPIQPHKIKPLQLLIPSVDDHRTIESFVKCMQEVPKWEAICVVLEYPTLDAHTNLGKWADVIKGLKCYDFLYEEDHLLADSQDRFVIPLVGQDRSAGRRLKFRYDPLSRMRRHGYSGAPPRLDISILSFHEDPESILMRILHPPVKPHKSQKEHGEDLQDCGGRGRGDSIQELGKGVSSGIEAVELVEEKKIHTQTEADFGDQETGNKPYSTPEKRNPEDSNDEQSGSDSDQKSSGSGEEQSDTEQEQSDEKKAESDYEQDEFDGEEQVGTFRRRRHRMQTQSDARPTGLKQNAIPDAVGHNSRRGRTIHLERRNVATRDTSVVKRKDSTLKMASPVQAGRQRAKRNDGRADREPIPRKSVVNPQRLSPARAQPVRRTYLRYCK